MEMIKNNIKTAVEKGTGLTKEVFEKATGYMLAAFGLVAALAWNEAIKSLIDYFFPLDKGSILMKFIYAVLVTALLVWVTFIIVRFNRKESDK